MYNLFGDIMKIMFVSDIHGSNEKLDIIKDIYFEEKPDRIIFLALNIFVLVRSDQNIWISIGLCGLFHFIKSLLQIRVKINCTHYLSVIRVSLRNTTNDLEWAKSIKSEADILSSLLAELSF